MDSRREFESFYSDKFPKDKSTMTRGGRYNGFTKRLYWEIWCARQKEFDYLNDRIIELQGVIDSSVNDLIGDRGNVVDWDCVNKCQSDLFEIELTKMRGRK